MNGVGVGKRVGAGEDEEAESLAEGVWLSNTGEGLGDSESEEGVVFF